MYGNVHIYVEIHVRIRIYIYIHVHANKHIHVCTFARACVPFHRLPRVLLFALVLPMCAPCAYMRSHVVVVLFFVGYCPVSTCASGSLASSWRIRYSGIPCQVKMAGKPKAESFAPRCVLEGTLQMAHFA